MSYYRRPVHYGGGGISLFGPLTEAAKYLLIANVSVFVIQLFSDGFMIRWFALIPATVFPGVQLWRLFTYMFMHGDFAHILFNMLVLWWFGSPVEQRLGMRRFVFYYFLCGVGSGLVSVFFYLSFGGSHVPILGASGALMGMFMAFALLYPNAQVLLFFVVPVKAKWLVVFFVIMEFAATVSYTSGAVSGVANIAHLSGLLIGYFYLRRLDDLRSYYLRARLKYLGAKSKPKDRPFRVITNDDDDKPTWLH